jgi:outer membrane receptor for ferrienterochelin and colicins
MKSIFISFFLSSIYLLVGFKSNAQTSKDTTVVFKVHGACEQCKDRIETAARGKGVVAAKWNVETNMLSLKYNPSKTSALKIQERIAAVGHDTELKSAPDDVYKALPGCCLYRELEEAGSEEEHHHTTEVHHESDTTVAAFASP